MHFCFSDLHAAPPDFQVGVTMGHESAGEVVAIGRDVRGRRIVQEIHNRGSFTYDDEFPAAIDLLAARRSMWTC